MSEAKPITLSDLQATLDKAIIEWQKFRDICAKVFTPEKLAQLEDESPNECPNCGAVIADADSFCDDDCKDAWWSIDKGQVEREGAAAQREDAAEAQHECARENFEARLEKMIDQAIEAKQIERKESHDQDA
jgi:hypothetical protein